MDNNFIGKAWLCQRQSSRLEPRARFHGQQDISMKAREAATACMEGRARASQLWYAVLQECRELGVDVISILSIPHESGRTLAGAVMISRDWDSCEALHGALADGVYLMGALVRQQDKILYKLDDKGRAIGLQFSQEGARYAGEFWQGMRHDRHGVLDFNNGVVYDGGFLYGKMTGWGRSTMFWYKKTVVEGVFLDGEFLGNPQMVPQSRDVRKGFLKQCRKLMELRP